MILSPHPRGMNSGKSQAAAGVSSPGGVLSGVLCKPSWNSVALGSPVLERSSGWAAGFRPSDTAFLSKHWSPLVKVMSSRQGSLGQWFYAGAPFHRHLHLDLGKHFPSVSKISRRTVLPPYSSPPQPASVASSLGLGHAESGHGLLCHLCQRTWDSHTFTELEVEEGNPLATSMEKEPVVTADHKLPPKNPSAMQLSALKGSSSRASGWVLVWGSGHFFASLTCHFR